MQDFIDQAKKNGVTLLDKGRCQFCGKSPALRVAAKRYKQYACVRSAGLRFQKLKVL